MQIRAPIKTKRWACSSLSATQALKYPTETTKQPKHQQDTNKTSQQPLGWLASGLANWSDDNVFWNPVNHYIKLTYGKSKLVVKNCAEFTLNGSFSERKDRKRGARALYHLPLIPRTTSSGRRTEHKAWRTRFSSRRAAGRDAVHHYLPSLLPELRPARLCTKRAGSTFWVLTSPLCHQAFSRSCALSKAVCWDHAGCLAPSTAASQVCSVFLLPARLGPHHLQLWALWLPCVQHRAWKSFPCVSPSDNLSWQRRTKRGIQSKTKQAPVPNVQRAGAAKIRYGVRATHGSSNPAG